MKPMLLTSVLFGLMTTVGLGTAMAQCHGRGGGFGGYHPGAGPGYRPGFISIYGPPRFPVGPIGRAFPQGGGGVVIDSDFQDGRNFSDFSGSAVTPTGNSFSDPGVEESLPTNSIPSAAAAPVAAPAASSFNTAARAPIPQPQVTATNPAPISGPSSPFFNVQESNVSSPVQTQIQPVAQRIPSTPQFPRSQQLPSSQQFPSSGGFNPAPVNNGSTRVPVQQFVQNGGVRAPAIAPPNNNQGGGTFNPGNGQVNNGSVRSFAPIAQNGNSQRPNVSNGGVRQFPQIAPPQSQGRRRR